MVKLERFYAFIVAAPATSAALVFHGHQPNLSTPPTNRGDHVCSAICVAPLLHRLSRPCHSQPLYQLSYRGMSLYRRIVPQSRQGNRSTSATECATEHGAPADQCGGRGGPAPIVRRDG